MKPLISIIVPVYNKENYLDKCMETLLKQTYENFEIILINDGSTDMSKKVCEYFAASYSNVTLINKKNGGVSTARNAGLNASKGDLITFVDPDDYVSLELLEILYESMTKLKCDIVSCTPCIVNEGEQEKVSFLKKLENNLGLLKNMKSLFNYFLINTMKILIILLKNLIILLILESPGGNYIRKICY